MSISRFERFAPHAVGVLIVVFVVLAWPMRWYNDDSYITYRYAKHIADGHGFVWNVVDGEPIEGSSSLAWTYLTALGMKLGVDPVLQSHLMGLLAGALGIVLSYLAARRLFGLEPLWSLVPPLMLTLQRQWLVWSVGGLETQAAAVIAFAATLLLILDVRREKLSAGAISGLAFFVGTLFRPETPLLHLAAGVGAVLAARDRKTLLTVVRSGALHGVMLLLLVAWRMAVFGQPLPNTFYAKVGGEQFARGGTYVWQFLVQSNGWLWGALIVGGAIVCLSAKRRPALRRGLYGALCAQIVLWLGWIAYEGGGAWEFRFMQPLWPAIAVLSCAGAVGFLELTMFERKAGERRSLAPILALALIAASGAMLIAGFRPFAEVVGTDELKSQVDELLAQGEYLAPYLKPEDRMSIGWAGALPYATDTWHLDPWGLNDREIARRPFDKEGVLFHQRHATWDDMVQREVMFVDVFNGWLFEEPALPQYIRRPVMPWIDPGVMTYCIELPSTRRERFWIFASPRPRSEIAAWAEERGLPLRWSVPFVGRSLGG